jgi:hypothetical protein
MFGLVPPMLRLMAAMGIPQGDVVIALMFAAAVAAVVAVAAMMAVAAAMGVPLGDKEMVLAFAQLRWRWRQHS